MKNIMKSGLTLFLVTSISAALIGIVYYFTIEPIDSQRKKTQERALKAVLPQAAFFSEIETETSGSIIRIFEGTVSGDSAGEMVIIGYVVELEPEGYSGKINMMVGVSKTRNIVTGMRVLRHTETPGLGSNATKEKFFRKFDNKRLVPLKVIKTTARYDDEIEALTAATITTKAIANAVNEAIEWFNGEVKE